jgi:hypothetical protein
MGCLVNGVFDCAYRGIVRLMSDWITFDWSVQFDAPLRLANAVFPSDSAKRLVIVSDGSENLGQARPQVVELLKRGVGIDCVPISYQRENEVHDTRVHCEIARGEKTRARPTSTATLIDDSQFEAL